MTGYNGKTASQTQVNEKRTKKKRPANDGKRENCKFRSHPKQYSYGVHMCAETGFHRRRRHSIVVVFRTTAAIFGQSTPTYQRSGPSNIFYGRRLETILYWHKPCNLKIIRCTCGRNIDTVCDSLKQNTFILSLVDFIGVLASFLFLENATFIMFL